MTICQRHNIFYDKRNGKSCRLCSKIYSARWHAKNPDYRKEYAKNYWKKNKERELKRHKIWYANNREGYLARRKFRLKFNINNAKDKQKITRKKHYDKHREKILEVRRKHYYRTNLYKKQQIYRKQTKEYKENISRRLKHYAESLNDQYIRSTIQTQLSYRGIHVLQEDIPNIVVEAKRILLKHKRLEKAQNGKES